MREWTERHIRELVRDEVAQGGDMKSAALLLRLWLVDMPIATIKTYSGGTITITPEAPGTVGILDKAAMDYKMVLTNCNWKGDWFVGPSFSQFKAAMTINSIDSGSFWADILGSLFYQASGLFADNAIPGKHQVRALCDGVETDATVDIGITDSWYDSAMKYQMVAGSDGVYKMYGTRVPDGTKTVTVYYRIVS